MTTNTGAWTPIHNPYIVGNPIKGRKMFFGREDDFTYLKTKLAGGDQGGLMVLCGARRSGKTSILFQILDGRLGDTFLPVLVDMQSMAVASDDGFMRKVTELITVAVDADDVTVESAPASDNTLTDFERFMARMTTALGDRRLVLALDEYELIETHIDSGVLSTQVLHILGNAIEHQKVYVVFTGSDKLEERDKPYWDIFLSKALHRRISFLSHDDTLRLVHDPVADVVEYEEGVAERIYELTAGQPFYTQVICQSVVDHLNDERRTTVAHEDIDRVVEEVIENPLPQMIFHWNALSRLEKLTLSIIAELSRDQRDTVTAADVLAFPGREDLGYRIEPGAANKTLEALFHGDLVQKSGDADNYAFKMDLWRQWAVRMHSVWKVINEIEQEGGPAPESGIVAAQKRNARRGVTLVAATAIVVAIAIYTMRGSLFGEAPLQTGAVPLDAAAVVVTSRPTDARVEADGELLGFTPLTRRVAAGSLVVNVTHHGYTDIVDTLVTVTGDTLRSSYLLEEHVGDVIVISNPPGASISLDGKALGTTTPDTLHGLSVNREHDIRVALAGFNESRRSVRAVRDSVVAITHEFARRRAPLTVHTVPAGADIYVDGSPVGRTPYATPSVAHGAHDVRILLTGYREWRGEVVVPATGDRVDIELQRVLPGVVRFSITPFGDVFVDGKRMAQNVSFYPLPLEPGVHQIELRHPQYDGFIQQINLESGDTLRVVHDFTG